jgi:hypothetical protein
MPRAARSCRWSEGLIKLHTVLVKDVFDTSGCPPDGWMNAIFDGGPFGDDVGRCVPRPPLDKFSTAGTTYFLRQVGSWSAPEDNPIAIYGLRRMGWQQHPLRVIRYWAKTQRFYWRMRIKRWAAFRSRRPD